MKTTTTKFKLALRLAQAIDAGNVNCEGLDDEIADAEAQQVTLFDVLRTHILLGATDGNAALVGNWLQPVEDLDPTIRQRRRCQTAAHPA